MFITTQNPGVEEVKKMINSCGFLDEKFRTDWQQKVDKLPENSLEFVYNKFKDAKNKVENVYIKIALKHDPTGGDLTREVLSTINEVNKNTNN